MDVMVWTFCSHDVGQVLKIGNFCVLRTTFHQQRHKMTQLADDLFPNHESVSGEQSVLDAQITSYLVKLDQYRALRDSVNKRLSSGFIELARAKYTSGRDYGCDFWDLNAKATRRAQETAEGLTIVDIVDEDDEVDEVEDDEDKSVLRSRKEVQGNEKNKPVIKYDTINMFGVLVPESLRLSQREFRLALNDTAQLINLQQRLGTMANTVQTLQSTQSKQ